MHRNQLQPTIPAGQGCEEMPLNDAAGMMQSLIQIKELPTLSPVATRVVGMILNTDTTARDLAQIIEKDPAMVSKLLKLVNSSFFGFSSRITSVVHAIMILGFNTVLNAVLSMAVIDAFRVRKYKSKGLDLETLWRHAISVAVIARHMGRSIGGQSHEYAFSAGILHDIGKIVMAIFFAERFIELQQSAQALDGDYLEAERRHFPIGHASLGAIMAGHWKLPDELTHVIAHHHHPVPMGKTDNMVMLIHAADALVNIHIEKNGPREKWPICPAACNLMGDKISSVDQWITGIRPEIEAACQSMLEI
jgi:putative nucleotidyltransferase with HDIG domain